MKLPNTPTNQQIRNVAASMGVEDMYMDEEFIKELSETNSDKAKLEALRQEIIKKYQQPKP